MRAGIDGYVHIRVPGVSNSIFRLGQVLPFVNHVGGASGVLDPDNPVLDLIQPVLDLRNVNLRSDAPLVGNFRACLETSDAPLQCGAIDHPPNENEQQGDKGDEQSPGFGRSVQDAKAQSGKRYYSPKSRHT